MIRRVAFALLVGGVIGHPASAQAPSGAVHATPQSPARRELSDVPPPPPVPADLPRIRPEDRANPASAKRSITRLKPLPRRASSLQEIDSRALVGRFANPGGVGRYSEYYTANTPTSQVDLHPVRVAGFDQGGGPNRAEQIAAFRAGQVRAANIQNNINAYGRPYGAFGAGFGFGFGLGAGRLYGYPY
jgi:hypothetical protein